MKRLLTPRMQGIYEQYRRARHYIRLAHRCKRPVSKFTNLITAVYPSRAIIELMLEAADEQEINLPQNSGEKNSRDYLESVISQKLPYYFLVEKIRIHDFHRFGCIPPPKKRVEISISGPIKLTSKKGIASIFLKDGLPESRVTGESFIKEHRSLCIKNGLLFFDEDSKKYIPLDKILGDFLNTIPKIIEENLLLAF